MMGESRDARSSPIDVGLDQGSEATKDDTCKGLCLLEMCCLIHSSALEISLIDGSQNPVEALSNR
jgi:hypothetical protein